MTGSEIISFIFPQTDDLIQMSFLSIMSALMIGTVVSTHLTARTNSWEKKWNRNANEDGDSELDIEHGSVTDLWHAVATAPEKLAEIMPGMLLVIGLLGTFLGLGLALNKASIILGQADAMSTGAAAADSMNNLMGVLQGLGSKFKTSTWGIVGFVLLKIWSEVTRFEEKRLTWVIGKVKHELEKRKKDELAAEASKLGALHRRISDVAAEVVQGFSENVRKMIAHDEVYQEKSLISLRGIQEVQSSLCGDMRATKEAMEKFSTEMLAVVEKMAKGAEKMVDGSDRIGDAADRMGVGASKVGEAANGLVDAVDTFKLQFTKVLEDVRKDLGDAINDMSTQASKTLEGGSQQLSAATDRISEALGHLSEDVKSTMNDVKTSIDNALKIQRKASEEFTVSSEALNVNIGATTGVVEKLAKPIEDGLRSVADSGLHMRRVGEKVEKTLNLLRPLGESLESLKDVMQSLEKSSRENSEFLRSIDSLVSVQKSHGVFLKEINDYLKLQSSSDAA